MLKTKEIKAVAREALLGRYGTVIGAYFVSFFLTFLCGLLSFAGLYAAFGDPEAKVVVRIVGRGTNVLKVIRSDPKYSFIAVLVAFALLFVAFVVAAWLDYGRKKLMLELCRKDGTGLSTLFWCFKNSAHPWKLVAVKFLTTFFTAVPLIFPLFTWMIALATGHFKEVTTSGTGWFNALAIVTILTEFIMIGLSLAMVYSDVVILDAPETEIMDAIGTSFRIMRGKKIKLLWTAAISFLFWYIAMEIVPVAALWIMPYVEATVMVFYLNISGEVQETAAYQRIYGVSEAEMTAEEPAAAPAAEMPVQAAEIPAEIIPAAEVTEVTEVPAQPEGKEGEDHEMPVL